MVENNYYYFYLTKITILLVIWKNIDYPTFVNVFYFIMKPIDFQNMT